MQMEIREKKENFVLFDCPPEPAINEKLEKLIVVMRKNTTNLVVDFSDTNIITASNISALLKLRKLLKDEGHRLILSGLNPEIKGIFQKTNLYKVFEFADDKLAALATLNVA